MPANGSGARTVKCMLDADYALSSEAEQTFGCEPGRIEGWLDDRGSLIDALRAGLEPVWVDVLVLSGEVDS